MSRIGSSATHRELRRSRPAFWVLAVLALFGLAAVLGSASGPPERGNFAAPEAQRVLEDWRGNSASLPHAP